MKLRYLGFILCFICIYQIAQIKGFFLLPEDQPQGAVLRTLRHNKSQSSAFVPQSVTVLCINLDKDKKRYAEIGPLLNQLTFPYQRIAAVYGKALSESFLKTFVDEDTYKLFFNGALPGAGEVGCFLSHVKAWKQFLESRAEFVLILEDDARFDPTILKDLVTKLIVHTKSWDICSLFAPLPRNKISPILKLSKAYELVRTFDETSGSVGVMLNRKAAHALLSKVYRYTLPLDHYIQRTWEFTPKLQFAIVTPSPIIEEGTASSIAQTGRRDRPKVSQIYRAIQRVQTQICHLKSKLSSYIYTAYLDYRQ